MLRTQVKTQYSVVLFLALALLAGCSGIPVEPLKPNIANLNNRLFLAHGASSGSESMNSLDAIRATLQRDDYDGIEIDIILTGDGIPVLAHDPWLKDDTCRRNDGQSFEPVFLRNVLYSELSERFVCRFPAVDGKSDDYHSLVTLADALGLVKNYPDKTLYLDLKIQENFTLDVEQYALEVFQVLMKEQIENPVFIEVPEVEQLKTIKDIFGEYNAHFVISYPAFYAGENWYYIGALAIIRTLLIADKPVDIARKSSADVLMSPTIVMTHRSVDKLHEQSVLYGTFLVDDSESLNAACDHGAYIIITDISPGDRCGQDL